MLYMKKAINRVLVCMKSLVLGKKWHLGVVIYFFCMVVLKKGRSTKASSHYFTLFCALKN